MLCLLPLGCTAKLADPISQQNAYYQVIVKKPFEEVLDDAIFAVSERNFRLAEQLRIGKAIQERGYPDFPDYEVLLFCNLEYTRKILDIDPSMINFCPGRINIRHHDDAVIITAILWQGKTTSHTLNAYIKTLNTLSREIVDYAAEDNWAQVYDKTPDNTK